MRSATLALAGAAVLTAAGCATDSEPAASAPSSTTTVPETSTTAAATSGPIVVELGTEYEIPCSSVDSSTCMTVTFADVREGEQCDYLQEDQAIAIASPEVYNTYVRYPSGCVDSFRKGYIDVMQFSLSKQQPRSAQQ